MVLLARARVLALEAKEGEERVTLLEEAARPVADHAGVALRRHPPHRHGGGGAPNGLIAATAYVRGIVDVLRLMRARAVSGVGSLQGVEDSRVRAAFRRWARFGLRVRIQLRARPQPGVPAVQLSSRRRAAR